MDFNQDFIKAVDERDTLLTRIMLKDSLVVDPTAVEFDEMLECAIQTNPELFDSHDGELYENDTTNWNKEYMDLQMVKVVSNFSKERIALLKDVCRHVYKGRVDNIENERKTHHSEPIFTKNQIGIGLTIGGIAIAVVGLVASKPLVFAAGAVVVVLGGYTILKEI